MGVWGLSDGVEAVLQGEFHKECPPGIFWGVVGGRPGTTTGVVWCGASLTNFIPQHQQGKQDQATDGPQPNHPQPPQQALAWAGWVRIEVAPGSVWPKTEQGQGCYRMLWS